MKVPQLLLQYLLDHKSFQLEGLGTIRLEAPPAGFYSEKGEISIPSGAISFEADSRSKADEGFITFAVQQTGKMRSLIASDLESYTGLGKQLLNISKPFVLEQVGVLTKDAQGQVLFSQGEIVLDKEESSRRKAKAPESEEGIHFEENYLKPPRKPGGQSQMAGLVLMSIAGLALLGWVSWYFYNKTAHEAVGRTEIQSPPAIEIQESKEETTKSTKPAKDTVTQAPPVKDTTHEATAHVASTPVVNPPANAVLAGDFKVVILLATKERALRRYDSLIKWGHNVVMSPVDSNLYELAIPIHAPLSDSAYHRDSLGRFFGRKVWVETR